LDKRCLCETSTRRVGGLKKVEREDSFLFLHYTRQCLISGMKIYKKKSVTLVVKNLKSHNMVAVVSCLVLNSALACVSSSIAVDDSSSNNHPQALSTWKQQQTSHQ
jgi:hypothetical protein